MKNFVPYFLILHFLCFISCAKVDSQTTDSQFKEELDVFFTQLFPDSLPGAAVLVVKEDSIIYGRGFGFARLDSIAPIDLNTLFNICSISKQFSAVAILKLEEDGKLSLDDGVLKYFPNLPHSVFKNVKLKHLLSHTSGIPDSRPRTEDEWRKYISVHPTKFKSVDDFKLYCEEDESLRYLETLDSLAFPPGTRYEYINPTFQMVLSIIEQVTGENFDHWMRNNIFTPANMPSTLYYAPGFELPRLAHGYIKNNEGKWVECDYGEANFFGTKADGGLYTSPIEFARWNNAFFSDKILSQSSRRKAHSPYIQTDLPYTYYGYGWFIERRPDIPAKIFHTGDNGGFLTFEGFFPDKNLFYLIFATHPHWNREKTVEKVDSIFQKYNII